MSQKINFSDYSASGVYFLEIDDSVISGASSQNALRLAVGFNMRGPFNRPVWLSDTGTCTRLFGPIDRKLERRGCFTNRSIRTMLRKDAVYVMNLLKVDTSDKADNKDKVGYAWLSADSSVDSSTGKANFAYMYDRTRFWIADDVAFKQNVLRKVDASGVLEQAPLFGIANCGTKDLSVIVRKSENVQGYKLSFLDYYGSKENIPYAWINPNDYVCDYFFDVYAFSGNWDDASVLSTDKNWSAYFDASGLKKAMLGKFINAEGVNLVGAWTGSVIPNFTDAQGNLKSIDYLINKSSNETGLMISINEEALEALAYDVNTKKYYLDIDGDGERGESEVDAKYLPDFVTTTLKATSTGHLSDVFEGASAAIASYSAVKISGTEFALTSADVIDASTKASKVSVGDFVEGKDGRCVRIIKKQGLASIDSSVALDASSGTSGYFKFTTNGEYSLTQGDPVGKVTVHKDYANITKNLKFFYLAGLKISSRHMPGFDASGAINNEAGVEKIYSMLSTERDENGKYTVGDEGIVRGLLNNNKMDFRYIVDTMAYGLRANCGGKKYLSQLGQAKFHATAIINAPSITQFASSDAPFFGDDWFDKAEQARPQFNVKYIPEGGNTDMIYDESTEMFSLPSEDNGATHAAVFSPFLIYREGNRRFLVPPAADVANAFMKKFNGGDPYKAIANKNGILDNPAIDALEYDFDDEERGYLEKFGINPIIDRDGVKMIFGDKTAYQTVDSDLSNLHCRELLNTIQIVCKGVLDDYVFSYNIPTMRAEIERKVNPILQAMQDSGALVKFEVECDEYNNDKEVIDNKFGICEIGVWMSQLMEKIIVPITVHRSTTA